MEDDGDDVCGKTHVQKHRKGCGHLTCIFNKGYCIICAAEQDVDTVKELQHDNCKSSSLKRHLKIWLKEATAHSLSKNAIKQKR